MNQHIEDTVESILGYALDYSDERHLSAIELDKAERKKILTIASDEFKSNARAILTTLESQIRESERERIKGEIEKHKWVAGITDHSATGQNVYAIFEKDILATLLEETNNKKV